MKKTSLIITFVVFSIAFASAADVPPTNPKQIEAWWKAGKTLPLETVAHYPQQVQGVQNDTGINVLVDMSHKCDFFLLWRLGGMLNSLGYRSIGSHGTLDSVLDQSGQSRVRVPVERGVNPFGWWPNPKINVVLTEGATDNPDYLPEERQALKTFIHDGGGLIVCGSSVKEGQDKWSLNTLLGEYGAEVLSGSDKYEGTRYPELKVSEDWDVFIKGDNGRPICARRRVGSGRIVLMASSQLYRFDPKDKAQTERKSQFLSKLIQWVSKGSEPAGGEARLPVARGGGGGIYPESEVTLPGIVCYYSKNQSDELVNTVKNDFPAITDDIYGWLPSPKPEQPMYLILCSGTGGGWAVNAYLPKEASTISNQPGGIRSIFAHEQAHTMSGPCAAADHPFGGNQGEEHAGWFQGKINAKYNGDRGANRGCERVFAAGYDNTPKPAEQTFKKEHLEKWAGGHDRMMIWYVWQKLDDRYGPTWYPRWRWVQGQRWKNDPKRKLTWDESIEDMSIAVGEDLFPFFEKTGKQLSHKRLEKIDFMGQTITLPVAPIEATRPGDVCLDSISDYTKPVTVRKS